MGCWHVAMSCTNTQTSQLDGCQYVVITVVQLNV